VTNDIDTTTTPAGPPLRSGLLATLERFYDAVPRDRARIENLGPFVLFVRDGEGHPFYARPRLGAEGASANDFAVVRQRQRALGIPESFEWVDDTTPGLIGPAKAAGLAVQLCPLLVLDAGAFPEPAPLASHRLHQLDPDSGDFGADLANAHAVGNVAFGHGGTATGVAGASARDIALRPVSEEARRVEAGLITAGRHIRVLAVDDSGPVAVGTLQRVGDVAEVAGVGTLPAARRQGLAQAVTAELVRLALAAGTKVVFLSAEDEDVARIYARLGFRRTAVACIAEPATAD
jgi:ribosomal protein S18 acetylase RimI-like enzyme